MTPNCSEPRKSFTLCVTICSQPAEKASSKSMSSSGSARNGRQTKCTSVRTACEARYRRYFIVDCGVWPGGMCSGRQRTSCHSRYKASERQISNRFDGIWLISAKLAPFRERAPATKTLVSRTIFTGCAHYSQTQSATKVNYGNSFDRKSCVNSPTVVQSFGLSVRGAREPASVEARPRNSRISH